jgi:outer membrane protein assembly factor BamE (lipoprotein component of BamABCDE complex)
MKNIFYLILFIFFNTSCSFEKVVKHHGIHFLEKKQEKIKVFDNNKNDVKSILGPPSSSSFFDNELWIYIERKTTASELKTLGRKKILVNNVLLLEFDSRGLLVKKNFYDKENMKKIKITEGNTKVLNKKKSFIDSIITSLRQKINDPLGQRKAK